MSILGPVLIAALYAVPILLVASGGDDKTIQVIDDSGMFEGKFSGNDKLTFIYEQSELEESKSEFLSTDFDALLYIPPVNIEDPQGFVVYSEKGLSATTVQSIERTIENEIEEVKLRRSGIDKETLEALKTSIDIKTINLSEQGEKDSNVGASTVIGFIGGIMVYFFIFLYGAQVMRGVLEEKTSRIVEVIISSVKPFQLMMGKIVGIAGVGLTQILIWIVLGFIVISLISPVVGALTGMDEQMAAEPTAMSSQLGQAAQETNTEEVTNQVLQAIGTINFPLIIGSFVFYFMFGYLMYAALFGAVGAAVDSETDSQQFMLPVTIPLILAIGVSGVIITEPNGQIAFWFSIIPLTSPVIMMLRIPFVGASWELYLSMALLFGGFLLTTWFAARIYRVGILMYGKKATYKELAKWFFYKV